ncbi:hypothetical protein INT45_006946 [Circinella minor]|uniref:AAA+ ATPase domain-containing protein n=1 Tax=Circinella minor TaxID=1195481 RepID=A0A8H7S5T3_9FUNG|nr:hypothetical protein INT45_006946 [Circinella minor]
MSTVLVSRLAKLTLQQSRSPRWITPNTIPITSYLLSSKAKKASTAAATPAPATNNNNNESDNSPISNNIPSNDSEKSTLNQNNVNASNATENPTKGQSFIDSNYLRHQSIPTQSINTEYIKSIPDYLWEELGHVVEAGLASKGALAAFNHSDHILLNIPGRGATFMQDSIARQLAIDVGADLVIFDAQDFVAMAQSVDENVMTILPSMSISDSGTTAVVAIRPDNIELSISETIKTGGDQTPLSEYDPDHQEGLMGILEKMNTNNNKTLSTSATTATTDEEEEVKDDKTLDENKSAGLPSITSKTMEEITTRYTAAFERILQYGHKEKGASQIPKLIYLRDYGDMHGLPPTILLKSLMSAVENLKQKGHKIVALAGYSPSLTSTQINYKQALDEDEVPLMSTMKCISIPPPLYDNNLLNAWESQMKLDTARRMGEINAKQLLIILQQKNVNGIKNNHNHLIQQHRTLVTDLATRLEGIQENIWTGIEIERHVTFAIGHALRHKKTTVDLEDIIAANQVVRKSVMIRKQLNKTLESQKIRLTTGTNDQESGTHGSNIDNLDITELKKYCDEYEQRFLTRIVDPYKVQVSFDDIRAPSTTIDTLQTLITLPLARPDLFRRGILKKNFIPGVLLFGPPGTGKTMLAKAICKAGGSRMLEVQASDIYEMYLGEGEKNVKALFSLARKLASPSCVIFIDEVDSIMSRRRSDSTSNAHREIINQFMVEWDGLTSDNQGVIVMAATNRPRDLDDAVLRRLPRRILVDLPNEEDRREILRMLLQDEEEHKVSVAELARATRHFSGSDLKNLCVTAALKAAQKEAITQEKQILNQSYFNEALKLVRPSSSEDMDTIKDLRKWASEYGDGGIKRKQKTIGFSQ